MGKVSGKKTPRHPTGDWTDLLALVAVLTSGVLLIKLGHLTAGGLTTACAALAGVYVAWRRSR